MRGRLFRATTNFWRSASDSRTPADFADGFMAAHTLCWDGPSWAGCWIEEPGGAKTWREGLANQPWAGLLEQPANSLLELRLGFRCHAGHSSFWLVKSPWDAQLLQQWLAGLTARIPLVGGLGAFLDSTALTDTVLGYSLGAALDGFTCYHGHRLTTIMGWRWEQDRTQVKDWRRSNRGSTGLLNFAFRHGVSAVLKTAAGGRSL